MRCDNTAIMGFQCHLVFGHKKDIINNRKWLEPWINKTMQEADPLRTDDRTVLNPSLRKAYEALIIVFPPMNGRDAVQDDDLIEKTVDYCLTSDLITIDCGYSQANELLRLCSDLAGRNGLTLCWTDIFELEKPHKAVARRIIYVFHPFWKSFLHGLGNGGLLFGLTMLCLGVIPCLLQVFSPSPYLWLVLGLSLSLGIWLGVSEYREYKGFIDLTYDSDISSVTVTVNGLEKEYSSVKQAFEDSFSS